MSNTEKNFWVAGIGLLTVLMIGPTLDAHYIEDEGDGPTLPAIESLPTTDFNIFHKCRTKGGDEKYCLKEAKKRKSIDAN